MMSLGEGLILTLLVLVVGAISKWSNARIKAKFEADFARRRPVGEDGIVVGADAVYLRGSDTHAVLLTHGFGDTPQSVRPLADALHAAGWTVHSILLPGHGRPLSDYAAARTSDWLNHVRSAYTDLRATHDTVVVCGISMGAALSAVLAAEHPEIPAVVLLAPYLSMTRAMHIKTVLANWLEYPIPYHVNTGGERSIHDDAARARTLGTGVVTGSSLASLREVSLLAQEALPSIKARVLYLQSREDNRLSVQDAEAQFARIGSRDKQQRWLTGCGHIITVDFCKNEVARQAVEWFEVEFERKNFRKHQEFTDFT